MSLKKRSKRLIVLSNGEDTPMSDTQTGPTEVLVLSDNDDDDPSPSSSSLFESMRFTTC